MFEIRHFWAASENIFGTCVDSEPVNQKLFFEKSLNVWKQIFRRIQQILKPRSKAREMVISSEKVLDSLLRSKL